MSRKTFILGFVVVALLIVSLYRAKYGASDTAEEIAALKVEIEDAEARKEMLEADLAHMSRRAWIEEYARKRLGMAPARASQYVRADDVEAVIGPVQPSPVNRVESEEVDRTR